MTEPAMTWLPHDHPYIQLETDAAEVRYEDTGQAAIVEVGTDTDEDEGVFVRVQSWSPVRRAPLHRLPRRPPGPGDDPSDARLN
jgi:hypothetical protein